MLQFKRTDDQLDTIDHLLAFTKMNNSAHSTQGRRSTRRRGTFTDASSKSTLMDLNADVDLSTITEEAVETVFAGHNFRGSLSEDASNLDGSSIAGDKLQVPHQTGKALNVKEGITAIVDIATAPDSEWLLRTEAGAW